jgi:hypothetical protein
MQREPESCTHGEHHLMPGHFRGQDAPLRVELSRDEAERVIAALAVTADDPAEAQLIDYLQAKYDRKWPARKPPS